MEYVAVVLMIASTLVLVGVCLFTMVQLHRRVAPAVLGSRRWGVWGIVAAAMAAMYATWALADLAWGALAAATVYLLGLVWLVSDSIGAPLSTASRGAERSPPQAERVDSRPPGPMTSPLQRPSWRATRAQRRGLLAFEVVWLAAWMTAAVLLATQVNVVIGVVVGLLYPLLVIVFSALMRRQRRLVHDEMRRSRD